MGQKQHEMVFLFFIDELVKGKNHLDNRLKLWFLKQIN